MVAPEQNSIVDMFRPVSLSELDMPAYRDWRDKRVIAMMRLGLLFGAHPIPKAGSTTRAP